MSSDVPGLFVADGVPADLVRAGEPRLRSYAGRESTLLQRVLSRRPTPRLRRVLRPLSA